ncbi:twin-arginine translocation signal domain-containing protein [Aureimonas ureilytica]|nr:twin-arginine translocation signal domain-containing protein [Aureimonas ureilytica]
MINRRSLLRGMAAVAAAPLLPPIAAPAIAGSAGIVSSAEPLLSYAVGIADEWNWLPIKARSPEHAIELWLSERGIPSICEALEDGETTEPCGDCEFCNAQNPDVVRHEEWDGHAVPIGSRLWCESGLGSICVRCQDEAWLQEGGFFDPNGRLVCVSCETPAEFAARNGRGDA